MRDATQPVRSIAAEFALLFLRELEPKVADDPELLVSTEAVLSFAAIRHADPAHWEYWRAILEQHEKLRLWSTCSASRRASKTRIGSRRPLD